MPCNEGRRIVVFGGHAQLYSLLHTAQLVRRDYAEILVNPPPCLYHSGMATAVISAAIPKKVRVDIRRLVDFGGGRCVKSTLWTRGS